VPLALRLLGTGLAALGVGVVLGVALFVLVTYGHLYAVTRDARRILRALPREFAAELIAIVTWPLFAIAGRLYRGHGPGGVHPVVLLHGYGMNRTSFLWLGRALARRGIGPLYGCSYLSVRRVRASAQRLSAFIERVCALEQKSAVDMVCHSLGGIVARYYVECLGGAERVARIITIGTPHRGTRTGRFALFGSGLELLPGSEFWHELLPEPHEKVPLTSIYSLADNVIVPPESARAFGAGDEVVFDDLGHMALLWSPRVADAVAARLAADHAGASPVPSPSPGRPNGPVPVRVRVL